MKEFIKTNTVTYNLMSFTGFKSLMLFASLVESPKSYPEIADFFKSHPYIKEEISIDTFRVYLTSLKRAGCVIQRDNATGKYSITSHPFELKISDDQIKSLIKIYRIIMKVDEVSGLLAYEKFLKNLAEIINNEKLIAAVNKVSVFVNLDYELIRNLINHAKQNRIITVLYNSPRSGIKEICIQANKVAISQNKLYLYGISKEYKQEAYFLVQRIIKLIDVDLENKDTVEIQKFKVGYELKAFPSDTKLTEDEKIVEIRDNSIIIETEASNMFIIKQKILEYGPLCRVLYPENLKNQIIDSLNRMKEGYLDE